MIIFGNELHDNNGNRIAVFSSHYNAFCALNMLQNPNWKPLNPSMLLSTDYSLIQQLANRAIDQLSN